MTKHFCDICEHEINDERSQHIRFSWDWLEICDVCLAANDLHTNVDLKAHVKKGLKRGR